MPRYLDPKADVTFKKVFGEHKELLISFLNALLPLEEKNYIVSLEYLQPELEEKFNQGRIQGLEQGREQERIDNIKRMRAKGCEDSVIADFLGLDLEYVANL